MHLFFCFVLFNDLTPFVDFNAANAIDQLRSVPINGTIELEGLQAEGEPLQMVLRMDRFRVFKPDTRIRINDPEGNYDESAPNNTYFRGRVLGDPYSTAFLAIHEDNSVFGVVSSLSQRWAISHDNEGQLVVQNVTSSKALSQISGFQCDLDRLPLPDMESQNIEGPINSKRGGYYEVTVAAETDFEYYTKFGNTLDATNYIGDLIGFSSTVYLAELNTAIVVGDVSLWTTAADPWTQSTSRCLMYEFGKYWNDNNVGISRTTTHFFSGRASLSGIAWVGVLCRSPFSIDISGQGCSLANVSNYGGNYGVSMGLSGNFDINNPVSTWDILAVAHEIGHNFNSPHTHCYNGIGGNASPIDQCLGNEPGCYSGSTSLPCGMPGGGCGTLMSYCHLLAGGNANTALTLGLGHPFGIAPERVPTRMGNHVTSISGMNPACLPLVNGVGLFADGFESGNTSAWSVTVPKRNALAVNAPAALLGSFGLEVSMFDTANAYVSDLTPNGENTYRYSVRMDFNTLSYAAGESFLILETRDVGTIGRFGIEYSTKNGHRIRVMVRDDNGTAHYSPWFMVSSGEQLIEVEWRQSAAPGANDGVVILHLNGNFTTALDCVDNDSQVISSTAVGAVRGLEAGGSGSFYIDDFASFDDSTLSFQIPVFDYSNWPSPQSVDDLVAQLNTYRCL